MSSRGEWRARLEWPDDCENAFELSYAAEGSGVESHDLGHDQSLVTVACAGGAYQPSHRVYLLDAATSPPTVAGLAFPVYESADGLELELFDRTEIWGEIHVRPEHREISLLTLSRQLRDCGVWARYSVVAGGVERVESRALIPCPSPPGEPVDPEPGRPPAEWPVTRVPDGTPER